MWVREALKKYLQKTYGICHIPHPLLREKQAYMAYKLRLNIIAEVY